MMIHKDEQKEINNKINNSPTEAEMELIYERIDEMEQEFSEKFEDHRDIENENKCREKQLLMREFIKSAYSTEEGIASFKKKLPMTGMGYDYVSHSLEITIAPEHFTDKNIKKYIKIIRKIIGDEIDLTISPASPASALSCSLPGNECDPMLGGNRLETGLTFCTLGFKATYQGKSGFVTAGHCSTTDFTKYGQPSFDKKVGKTTYRPAAPTFTDCDCAFVAIDGTEPNLVRGMSPDIFSLFSANPSSAGSVTKTGKYVRTSGAILPYFGLGKVLDLKRDVELGLLNGNSAWILDVVVTNITTTNGGDSGSPVYSLNGTVLLGIAVAGRFDENNNNDLTYYVPQTKFSEKLGSTFSWDFN